jgi:hypothetical protein
MLLIRNGRESGHTVPHFHAHLALVTPGARVRLFNGNFRGNFPTDDDAEQAVSCITGFTQDDLGDDEPLDGEETIRLVNVHSSATGVASHRIMFLRQDHMECLAELPHELFVTMFQALGAMGDSPNYFVYYERARAANLRENMHLPIHLVEVAPGACVKVLGNQF